MYFPLSQDVGIARVTAEVGKFQLIDKVWQDDGIAWRFPPKMTGYNWDNGRCATKKDLVNSDG